MKDKNKCMKSAVHSVVEVVCRASLHGSGDHTILKVKVLSSFYQWYIQ